MSHTDRELISVVIPTRNRRARLERAITSVLAQTWSNFEVVVVDDASDDDTLAYLQQAASADGRIRFLHNESPCGGGGARNLGVAAAKGRYIAFLDDDDLWMPQKLAEQIALMEANPQASAVSCGFIIQNPFLFARVVRVSAPADIQQLLRSNHLGGASMCFTTKDALTKIHGFDPALPSGQDWDLWIKLLAVGEVLVCDEPLVCYVPHQGVRITSNPRSAYIGRRKIFLRYKSQMNAQTRRYLLCELIYHRKVLLWGGAHAKLTGLLYVARLAFGVNALRYLYRYLKLVVFY